MAFGYNDMSQDPVFDLHKLIRSSPIFNGWILRLFASLMSSVFGYPLRAYMGKFNLEPIENANIEEDPTFYPYHPVPSSPVDGDDVSDIKWQYHFLESNYNSNAHFNSILDYHKVYVSGEVTPEDVMDRVQQMVEDSEQQDPPLRCFTQLNWPIARLAASESALRYKEGRPLSVLDGLPIGVKDEFDVKQFKRCCGRLPEEKVNEADSDIVAVLRNLGVVIIGITNMHEMGMGITGINPHHGAVRNPYNDKHVSGGSSSGSAAAVAAGIVPFAIGSDGGGSVRIPSAFCGLPGIKPTFSRFSAAGTGFASSSVTSAGVIANNVADVALVYSLIANKAPDRRFFHLDSPITNVRCLSDKSLADITFGTYSEYVSYCQPEVLAVFESNIKPKLPNLSEVRLEDLYLSKIAHMNIILAETAQDLDIWRKQGSQLAPQTKIVFAVCQDLNLTHYMHSSCQKKRAMKMFEAIFEEIDILITPTTACLPKEIDPASLACGEMDELNLLYTMWFVYLANLCGLPALTINAGYSSSGLPVGVMVTTAWWKEDLLLRAAQQLETPLRKPQRSYPSL